MDFEVAIAAVFWIIHISKFKAGVLAWWAMFLSQSDLLLSQDC